MATPPKTKGNLKSQSLLESSLRALLYLLISKLPIQPPPVPSNLETYSDMGIKVEEKSDRTGCSKCCQPLFLCIKLVLFPLGTVALKSFDREPLKQ